MRTGPLGHRDANSSRLIERLPARSASAPGAARDPLKAHRLLALSPGPPHERLALRPTCLLSINLREFLMRQFGHKVRFDDDGVMVASLSVDEEMLCRLARAIRRFSADRAREPWSECAVPLDFLKQELNRITSPDAAALLCLRCARFDTGAGALERHLGGGCVEVQINGLGDSSAGEGGAVAGRLLRIIEGFRLTRAALNLPHFDLDCYVAREQAIFTWRPLARQ